MTKNIPEYIETAAQAGKALTSADNQTEKGLALAVVSMHDGYNVFEFDYAVIRKTDKDGTPTEQDELVTATIDDLFTPIPSENGKSDSKANGQRLAAFAKQFFGIDELSPAQNTCIRRAMTMVHYLRHVGADCAIVKGSLAVPFGAFHPAPSADASEIAKMQYEAVADKLIPMDRKEGRSLNALLKRSEKVLREDGKMQTAKRNSKSKVAPAKSLKDSIAFLNKELGTIVNSDESDVALTDQNRKSLFLLQQQIAAIFEADPMDSEELETIAA